MTEHKFLDASADVLPVGLQPTPFGEVWQALQQVAAQVWDVDPSVYRAGIAWMWYALRNPSALDADGLRPLLVSALISEQAPMVKDWQTNAELVEYLRVWRTYSPTYAKLEAIFATFGARVEVRPISDAESQSVVPVADRRLAFYLRVEDFDAARPLTLDEVYQIAVRATPLGSRPVPYFALVGSSDVFAGSASAGLVRALWASEPAVAPPMSFVVVDSATGAIVHGFNQELTTYELPSVILNSEDGYETYELPSVSLPTPSVVIGVPISGLVQAFWFTDDGRDETNDKTFTVVGNPLFDEDGSVARNELYDGAVPLSFMQHDGNMFEADSDSDIVRYLPVTDRLVLSIPGDSTTRGKSAWSVQVAKLFVLSYANTQLPDVQIELPINEVGTYGTVITLPTIDGEYESGGKTWKPSAWDIGAFGSSYTLNADTVAHLVFTEVVQYTEITLYYSTDYKYFQGDVTSGFTGNVSSGYCYQLYTDEQCTIPWTGYDYSNDYEVGWYNNGVWEPLISKVEDMPSIPWGEAKRGFILMDTGCMWHCLNVTNSSACNTRMQEVIRIYQKGQQYYSLYGGASRSVYNNVTISNGGYLDLYGIPNKGSNALTVPWGGSDTLLPTRTLQAVLGSAGNSVSGLSLYNGSNSFRVQNLSGASREFRTVVFTLSKPTIISYTNTTNTVVTVNSSTPATLYDNSGNTIQYDARCSYIVLGAFGVSGRFYGTFGAAVTDRWAAIQNLKLTANGIGNLQVELVGSETLSINKIWYIKTPAS